MTGKLVIFIHGWSVRSTDTYGSFPDRLDAEAESRQDLDVDVRHIWLARYVSFRDEVRMVDLARGFEAAVRRELGAELAAGRRFACITHSTGGPVVRDWWQRFYGGGNNAVCPMSHLIMLAPANFGSALAQLGKSRISRLKTWFQGVEPGAGVLDWLELGSPESWAINQKWIGSRSPAERDPPVFVFTLTGQTIDRALYDHVNSYTGESGSDGVVRVAAANLNANYVRLVQEKARRVPDLKKVRWAASKLKIGEYASAPRTAFAVLPGLAHSGAAKGILRSVGKPGGKAHPTVTAVMDCLSVRTKAQYDQVCDHFDALTQQTQDEERTEYVDRILLPNTRYHHERHTMIVVRICDDHNYPLNDLDFLLTAQNDDPDKLPEGFFADRQRNQKSSDTLTLFLNHDVMTGRELLEPDGTVVRAADPTAVARGLGFRVTPRPSDGIVHYLGASFAARVETLVEFMRPNSTLLLDIVMRRIVRTGVFTHTQERKPKDFTKQDPGDPIDLA